MIKVMKTAIGLAIVLMVFFLVSSCKSTHQCSAYGEVKKHQRESRR
jgi:hypothetical protein